MYGQSRQKLLEQFYKPLWESYPNMIRLDSLFEKFGADRRAIIDDCHYSPEFNEFLAQEIKNSILSGISFGIPDRQTKPVGKNRDLSERQKRIYEMKK
jgi:hypothetical protein